MKIWILDSLEHRFEQEALIVDQNCAHDKEISIYILDQPSLRHVETTS